jgi:hypothetical protein
MATRKAKTRPSKRRKRNRRGPFAYTVPQAGAMIGLSRNGSYLAAAAGDIPTERAGRLLYVPKARWDAKLGLTGRGTRKHVAEQPNP